MRVQLFKRKRELFGWYLRTNLYELMSEEIAKSRGFEIMKNNNEIITEEVSFKRTNLDISEADTRKILEKRFK